MANSGSSSKKKAKIESSTLVAEAKVAFQKKIEDRNREKIQSLRSPARNSTSNPYSDFDNFVVDCDGVIWHGDEAIPGSIEALKRLEAAKCEMHFVTNSSGSTRDSIAAKLRSFGLKATSTQVCTSGSAAVSIIKTHLPQTSVVYVIGEKGLTDELCLGGLVVEGGYQDNHATVHNSKEFLDIELDPRVSAVVCGLDRQFNYAKLVKASLYLQRGYPLIATNEDAFDVLPPRGNMPGAGCLIAALSYSHKPSQTFVAGKPSGDLLRAIIQERGWNPNKTLVIGDRVDTDINFAKNAGIKSCLVLTGVSSSEHKSFADFVEESLSSFSLNKFPNANRE